MYDETTVQPAYAPQDNGYAEPPTPRDNGPRNRALLVVTACIVALFGLVGGAVLTLHARQGTVTFAQASGVATSAPGQSRTTADQLPSGQIPTDLSEVPVGAGDVPSTVGAPTNGGAAAGAPAPAPKAPAPAAPAGPAPVITSFHTPDNIDCHNGNSQTFSASWTTTNAVKTTVSIDGAGAKTYGPNADESLLFTCSKAHSYKLTAFAQNGTTVSKTITLQPRNVQPPASNEDDNSAPAAPTSSAPKK